MHGSRSSDNRLVFPLVLSSFKLPSCWLSFSLISCELLAAGVFVPFMPESFCCSLEFGCTVVVFAAVLVNDDDDGVVLLVDYIGVAVDDEFEAAGRFVTFSTG